MACSENGYRLYEPQTDIASYVCLPITGMNNIKWIMFCLHNAHTLKISAGKKRSENEMNARVEPQHLRLDKDVFDTDSHG